MYAPIVRKFRVPNASPRPHIPLIHLALIAALCLTPAAPTQAITNAPRVAATTALPLSSPAMSATKTDTLLVDNDGDNLADAGDALRYTVVLSNNGATDALGVVFSDTLDANTTLSGTVRASPIARNDVYSATQDVPLTVPAAGVLANDFGLPATAEWPAKLLARVCGPIIRPLGIELVHSI